MFNLPSQHFRKTGIFNEKFFQLVWGQNYSPRFNFSNVRWLCSCTLLQSW